MHTTILDSFCFSFVTGTQYGCSDSTRYKSQPYLTRYHRCTRGSVGWQSKAVNHGHVVVYLRLSVVNPSCILLPHEPSEPYSLFHWYHRLLFHPLSLQAPCESRPKTQRHFRSHSQSEGPGIYSCRCRACTPACMWRTRRLVQDHRAVQKNQNTHTPIAQIVQGGQGLYQKLTQ